MTDYIGRVNACRVRLKGKKYAPETLLITEHSHAWKSKREVFTVMYRPRAWNKCQVFGTQTYQRVVDAAGNPLYELIEFPTDAEIIVKRVRS